MGGEWREMCAPHKKSEEGAEAPLLPPPMRYHYRLKDWELRSQSSESELAKMRAHVEIKQKFKNNAQLL